ncbi:hypothetical protein ScPMuIL_009666 [Solemya velum]
MLCEKHPLHLACRIGSWDMVKCLLAHGAEVDNRDCGGCTPLFHAVHASQPGVVYTLIQAGCDLDTLNEELITPLEQALLYNHSKIVTLLFQGGCSLGKYDLNQYSDSILFSLWANDDTFNMDLAIKCGCRLRQSLLSYMIQKMKTLSWHDKPLNYLLSLMKQPLPLTSFCRIVIRKELNKNRKTSMESLKSLVDKLALPTVINDFLTLNDGNFDF